MTLHILNRRMNDIDGLLGANDEVVLIENAVYSIDDYSQHLKTTVYGLGADLEARGVVVQSEYQIIDYLAFVDLCLKHDKVVSW